MRLSTTSFLILLFVGICNSQSFELTPEGFKDYVIIEFPDKSKEEIFKSVKKWGEYNIRNAKHSNYSEIENEYLTYRILFPNQVEVGKGMMRNIFSIIYDLEIRVKDEKLRLDLSIVDMPNSINKESMFLKGSFISLSLYRKDGTPRRNKMYVKMRDAISKSSNGIITELKLAVEGKSDFKKEDW